jgi:electron transport complex protein RnfC
MRKVWDIHGGIHPEENKTQSNHNAIETAGIPEQLIFPLSQHIGAPAVASVEVGQRVLKGQQIAAAKGFVSVPVHASTSGTVIAIESRLIPHPSGMTAPCIVIEADGKDEWISHTGCDDYSTLDKTELLNRIREAGIAGMGGAGFPSAVKLSIRDDQTIETLIINGTECEPYITADDRLMRERADEIIEGTKILRYIINPKKETLIGVEDNKPECIAALQLAAKGSGIEIASFPTKYPSGGEKQLIEILTGKQVPSGGLPAQVGIVCQNVGTTTAIYRAIVKGEPLISRITTVTGFACEKQQNFETLLGTPVDHLLQLCQFDESQCSRLIMGGPMMGFTLESSQVPVVKTTNCILAPSHKELPAPTPPQACIRCGMCAEACPASLLPQQLYWFARGKEYEKLESHNLMDCIECGACSYACPSNIPLVQYYRASKADIRQQKADAIKAEQSKARFEARQERIAKQEAEKEAKRLQRKAAAEARAAGTSSNSGDKGDAISAAIERAKAKKAANKQPEPPVNAAQAAIEKAKAQRSGSTSEAPSLEKLQQTVASVAKRLAKAQLQLQKAEQEDSDKLEAFKLGVEKTSEKHHQAQQALDDFIAANPTPPVADAAQQAIARAQEKRANTADLTPLEKAQKTVDSLTTRVDKSAQKLEAARKENVDNIEIFETTLNNLKSKLEEAQQSLAALSNETSTSDEPSAEKVAAEEIIARALAKRQAASTMTDEQRLQNAVESITTRLTKAREKLATAESENDENTELFATAVSKLELKLADAQEAYNDYQQQN